MEEPQTSSNEFERLNNLKRYSIIGSNQNVTFDQLTHLASTICDTPVALISFLDSETQWVKSSIGIELDSFSRDISACNVTIEQEGLLEIHDLKEEKFLPYNEFLKNAGFRFYAGLPIKSPEGFNIGTICVLDYVTRKLTPEQVVALTKIRQQIEDLIGIRKEYRSNLEGFQDTEKVNLQRHQDIIYKAKTKAMAELSAGLTFRIKGHLKIIENAVNILEDDQKNSEDHSQMSLLKRASNDISGILDSLEKFIKTENEKGTKPLDLGTVLQEVIQHLEYLFKKFDITLKTDITSDIICIGNSSQLMASFYAILVNAIEAVDSLEKREIKVTLTLEDHVAVVKVSDSGSGILESIRPFIFQPFFTTKGECSLGIGLSLALTILKRHSGNLILENDKNPTVFRMELPVP